MGPKNDHAFISARLTLLSLALCAKKSFIVESFAPAKFSASIARNSFLSRSDVISIFGSFEDFGQPEPVVQDWVQKDKPTPPQKPNENKVEEEEEEESAAEIAVENDAMPEAQPTLYPEMEVIVDDSPADNKATQQKEDDDSFPNHISESKLTDEEIKQLEKAAESRQRALLQTRLTMEAKFREEEIAKAEEETSVIDEIKRQKSLLLERKSLLEAKLKYDSDNRQTKGVVSPDAEVKNTEETKEAGEYLESAVEERKGIDSSAAVAGVESSVPSAQINNDVEFPAKKVSSFPFGSKTKAGNPQGDYLENLADAAPVWTDAPVATDASVSSTKKGSSFPFGSKPKVVSPQNSYLDNLSGPASQKNSFVSTSAAPPEPAVPAASSEPAQPVASSESATPAASSETTTSAVPSVPDTPVVSSEPDTYAQPLISSELAESTEPESKEVAITPGYIGNFGDESEIYDPLLSLPMPKIPKDVALESSKIAKKKETNPSGPNLALVGGALLVAFLIASAEIPI